MRALLVRADNSVAVVNVENLFEYADSLFAFHNDMALDSENPDLYGYGVIFDDGSEGLDKNKVLSTIAEENYFGDCIIFLKNDDYKYHGDYSYALSMTDKDLEYLLDLFTRVIQYEI